MATYQIQHLPIPSRRLEVYEYTYLHSLDMNLVNLVSFHYFLTDFKKAEITQVDFRNDF